MTPALVVALAPVGLLLGGALLCLLLEAAGTPVGASKRGPRTHLAVVSLLALAAALVQIAVSFDDASAPREVFDGALVIDQVGLFSAGLLVVIGALAVIAGVPSLRELSEERGEVHALLLIGVAAFVLLVQAGDLLVFAGASLLATVSLAALASLERKAPHSAEAAAKLVAWSGLTLSFLGFGAALVYGASGSTAFAGLGLALDAEPGLGTLGLALVGVPVLGWLPAVPAHMARVDVTHGSPAFAGGLHAAGGLVAGAALALRLATAVAPAASALLEDALGILALLTLVVPALVALDQRQVSRMVAHLVVVQAGVLLPLLLLVGLGDTGGARGAALVVVTAAALTTAGAVPALAFFERPGAEGATWESWSGAGRRHPLVSLAFLWLLANVAGLPGTAGFAARLLAGEAAFHADMTVLGIALVVSPALAIAPVLRLAIFLFAKPPEKEIGSAIRGGRVLAIGLAVIAVTGVALVSSALARMGAGFSLGG